MPPVTFGFLMIVMAYQLARHTAKMSVEAMVAIAAAGRMALGVFLRLI
jgi:hypothetical protein